MHFMHCTAFVRLRAKASALRLPKHKRGNVCQEMRLDHLQVRQELLQVIDRCLRLCLERWLKVSVGMPDCRLSSVLQLQYCFFSFEFSSGMSSIWFDCLEHVELGLYRSEGNVRFKNGKGRYLADGPVEVAIQQIPDPPKHLGPSGNEGFLFHSIDFPVRNSPEDRQKQWLDQRFCPVLRLAFGFPGNVVAQWKGRDGFEYTTGISEHPWSIFWRSCGMGEEKKDRVSCCFCRSASPTKFSLLLPPSV